MSSGDKVASRGEKLPFDYHARIDHHVNNKKEYTAKVAAGINK